MCRLNTTSRKQREYVHFVIAIHWFVYFLITSSEIQLKNICTTVCRKRINWAINCYMYSFNFAFANKTPTVFALRLYTNKWFKSNMQVRYKSTFINFCLFQRICATILKIKTFKRGIFSCYEQKWITTNHNSSSSSSRSKKKEEVKR